MVVRDSVKSAFPEACFWAQPLNQQECQRFEANGFNTITRQKPKRFIGLLDVIFGTLGVSIHKQVTLEQYRKKSCRNIFQISNVVIDISGFVSSDQFGPRSARSRWKLYSAAKAAGNKIFFMPQAWGPFKNREVRLFTRLLLSNADLVCAREQLSYKYLVDARCVKRQKTIIAPDIAFQFSASPPDNAKQLLARTNCIDPSKPFITITPNMRIYERTSGQETNNAYFLELEKIMDYFLKETQCSIVLIPHETSLGRTNDPELCKMLLDKVQQPQRACMLTGNESAADIKSVIGLSEFLVASRYHSLIASMSMRVPATVIGWSHKYDELMKEVDLEQWVTDPVRRSDALAMETIVKAWEKRDTIRSALQKHVPKIEDSARTALNRMIDIIKSVQTG